MIDKSLNYGRHCIDEFARMSDSVGRVLDVGAGAGMDLDIIRAIHPNAEVVGIEGFVEFAEILNKKNIRTVGIDIERDEFPFESEFFDLVMSNQVLEHVKDIFWVLHNVSRVLKVGGNIIIGVPNLASLHNRILLALGRQPTSIGNHSAHIRGYTKHDLLRLLECGFPGGYELRAFRGGNFYPFPPMLARPLAYAFPSMAVSFFILLTKKKNYDKSFLEYPITSRLNTHFFVGSDHTLWDFDQK